MANNENLRVPTSEKAREIGRKGGLASGRVKAQKKTFQEVCKALLDMDISKDTLENAELITEKFKDKITVSQAIAIAQALKAISGDTKAAEFVRDTSGQKPTDNVNLNLVDDKTMEEVDELVNEKTSD